MSFNWRSYLTLAEELATQGRASDDEAKLRSSVSRAYYGAFRAAHNHLTATHPHWKTSTQSEHYAVWQQFDMSNDETRQQIAKYLNRLRLARVQADYHDVWTLTSGNVDFLMVDADEVFDLLQQLQR